MKNIILTTLLFFGILSSGYSQSNTYYQNKNVLPPKDFYNVSFNGITLRSIIYTKGDPAKVDVLFGTSMQVEKSKDTNYYWINFISPAVSFTFDELIGNLDLSGFEVHNNTVAVKIGGKIIHIGDTIEKLGNIKIFTGKISGTKFILYLPQGADGQSLRIDFDPATKIITKISYMAT